VYYPAVTGTHTDPRPDQCRYHWRYHVPSRDIEPCVASSRWLAGLGHPRAQVQAGSAPLPDSSMGCQGKSETQALVYSQWDMPGTSLTLQWRASNWFLTLVVTLGVLADMLSYVGRADYTCLDVCTAR